MSALPRSFATAVLIAAALVMLLTVHTANAETIEAVLDRSQQTRLSQRPNADTSSAAAQRVKAGLARLLALRNAGNVELVLSGGDLFAEALLDRPGLAVSQAVGDLPEGERLLLLAHELGHLRLGHPGALKALYHAHIPGEVLREVTDRAAAALGPDAHALSHRHELEADAYGYTLVRSLGFGLDNAFSLLMRQGMQIDSATHPGTRRRLAQLRALESQLEQEAAGESR
jgi:Peptidase family M48